jgi:hypothetical protein
MKTNRPKETLMQETGPEKTNRPKETLHVGKFHRYFLGTKKTLTQQIV